MLEPFLERLSNRHFHANLVKPHIHQLCDRVKVLHIQECVHVYRQRRLPQPPFLVWHDLYDCVRFQARAPYRTSPYTGLSKHGPCSDQVHPPTPTSRLAPLRSRKTMNHKRELSDQVEESRLL